MRYSANVPRFLVFWGLVNFYLWLPVWVIFLQNRGMTLSQIGVLDAIGWVVMASAEVPTGAVADTYGRKTSLFLGAVLFAVAMFAVTTRVLSPVFVLGYLLWGTSTTFISGADMALLYDSLKADGRAEEHPKVAGRYLAVLQASQAVASLGGAWLATRDMTLCFTITGVVALAAAGVALTFREPPREDAGAAARRSGYWQTIGQAVRITAERPVVRYQVLFGAVTAVFPFMITFVLVQPFATGVGIPLATLGGIVLALRVTSLAGSTLASRVSARIGPDGMLSTMPSAIVLSLVLLWLVPSQVAVGLFAIIAFANALLRPVLSALLNQEIPSAHRATILSLQSLLFTAMLAVVEPAVFTVATRASLPAALGLSGAALAVTALPLVVLWRRATVRAPAAEHA